MDMHLNFIVDQTEKYSSWLIESLATNAAPNPTTPPLPQHDTSSTASDKVLSTNVTDEDEDVEFNKNPSDESEDDESTIAREELAQKADVEDADSELKQLQMENEKSIEDLLKEYNINESYYANKEFKPNPQRSTRLKRRLEQSSQMEGKCLFNTIALFYTVY
jgi:hypothetical protein